MKKKKLINGIIIVAVLLLLVFAVVALSVKKVQDYHDANTFADLSIVTTKQECYLDADTNAKDSECFSNPVSSDVIKETFIKGDTFTANQYEFLVQDVEFEYAEIKIVSGEFSDESKTLNEGDIITLHEGESVDLVVPLSDDSFKITVRLDKLWWY